MNGQVRALPTHRNKFTVIAQWQSQWRADGKSDNTAAEYVRILRTLPEPVETISKVIARGWQADAPTAATKRQRARALNAVMKFMEAEELRDDTFTLRAPKEAERPQTTVTPNDVTDVLARAKSSRDKALILTMWATGMRRSEIVKMKVEHLDLDGGWVIIPLAKGGKPRIAPLTQQATAALYRWLRDRERKVEKLVLSREDADALWLSERGRLTAEGLKMVLRRLGSSSAHSYRRGWAVDSLRSGINQTDVQAAAGWSGPAMVSRYTRTLAQEMAMEAFHSKRR